MSLMNCLRGCFFAIVSAVLVLLLDDVTVADEFALVAWVCAAEILIVERKVVDGVTLVVGCNSRSSCLTPD